MTTFFTKCSVGHRVEVWFGEADQEHAENQRGSISSQPLHHLDGVAQVHGHGAPWQRHGLFMVPPRKRYIEIRAERKKAKMRFRRAMREEIMSKAPGMRWAFKTKDDQTLCWQVCGGREHNEEEEAKEAAGDPRPWEHQVGFRSGKCKKRLKFKFCSN